jgi:hypothetical protein
VEKGLHHFQGKKKYADSWGGLGGKARKVGSNEEQ